MAWQSINAFIVLISITNTLAGLLVVLITVIAVTSTTRLGVKRCRGHRRCARVAATSAGAVEVVDSQNDEVPVAEPPLRLAAVSCVLGMGLALGGSLLAFAIASAPTTYSRVAYRARQALPADAARSLRIEAARAGMFVGGLIRPDQCDTHLLGQEFTSVTLENDLKWKFLSRDGVSVTDYDFSTADDLISVAEAAQVRVRELPWRELPLAREGARLHTVFR